MNKRLFIGLKFTPKILATLKAPLHKIKRIADQSEIEARWTALENLHITLLFLGETDASEIEVLAEKLAAVANEVPAFPIRLEGVGAFPEATAARVIWFGVRQSKGILELQSKVASSMGHSVGEYTPHISIARLRNQKSVYGLIKPFARDTWGKAAVMEIELFESIQAGPLPVYKSLYSFPLKAVETTE